MKRFIWGVVLIILGIFALLGSGGDSDAMLGGMLFIVGGVLLSYYGKKYINNEKASLSFALEMIRENGDVDARQIANRLGVSEVDIRGYLAVGQRKGIIPFKVEII